MGAVEGVRLCHVHNGVRGAEAEKILDEIQGSYFLDLRAGMCCSVTLLRSIYIQLSESEDQARNLKPPALRLHISSGPRTLGLSF